MKKNKVNAHAQSEVSLKLFFFCFSLGGRTCIKGGK